MNILLVNDDGFDSGYLRMLCRAAAARGHRVRVCAPARQQSAKGHSFTITEPVFAVQKEMEGAEEAWVIGGTPVDCARIGIMELFPEAELVISGINYGPNAACAVFPSGTVGAAREAAMQGRLAIALSADYGAQEETVKLGAEWALTLAGSLPGKELPVNALLNINIPAVPVTGLKPPVMCPQSTVIYKDEYVRETTPRGDLCFWLAHEVKDEHPPEGTDTWYLKQGHITCTFIGMEPIDQGRWQPLLADI
ncbi:MAG: 5'/3'-nucleotidase SurE [Clostridia bacterium]|nr:5'/3'-nucleotidase SurE [Clostridia bacterium]